MNKEKNWNGLGRKLINWLCYLSLLLLMSSFPIILRAQGIHFEQTLNWQQVKEKAKAEHKYIFVDCYATWCVPCKNMEEKVYPLDSIGDFANSHYIPVKIQFDRTKADNDQVRAMYADAKNLEKEYRINAYPTFLFFSPDGKLVHRSIGDKEPKRFMGILRRSLDPAHQYYTLLESYRAGKMPLDQMGYLALLALSIEDEVTANEIAKNYIDGYLLKLDDQKLCNHDNIQFMIAFLDGKHDQVLNFFKTKANKINAVMANADFAQSRIIEMIKHVDCDSVFDQAKKNEKEPDWESLSAKITPKYGSYYGKRTLITVKLDWYSYLVQARNQAQYWPQLNKYTLEWVKELKVDTNSEAGFTKINNIAYANIFLHSDDKNQIKLALGWMKNVVSKIPGNVENIHSLSDVNDMDTYACLLYKDGQLNEALKWERKILEICSGKNKAKADYTGAVIAKMKTGAPFWLEKQFQ